MTTFRKQGTLVATSLLLMTLAHAGTSIADFNDNTPGPLGSFTVGEGQTGGTGWLTGDTWANTATIGVISGDLTAPPSTGYSITQSGTAQSIQGTNTAGRQNTREVESALTGTIWFSYLLYQPSADSRGGITFNQNVSAPGNPRVVAVGTETRLGLGATLQPAGGGTDLLTLGETALVLGRLTIDNTGNPEVLDVWINPDVSGDETSLPAPDTTISEETSGLDSGITRIGVQSYASDSQGGILDALRVSDAVNGYDVVTTDADVINDDPNLVVNTANPFGGLDLNTSSAPVTADILIGNNGDTNTLTISDTTAIAGGSAADYSILTTLPLDILPGEDAIVQVQLDPAGIARATSATLNLASNDPGTATVSITLNTSILGADGNQLINGTFEDDPTGPTGWTSTGTALGEGIAPGSTTSVSIPAGDNLTQVIAGEGNWYLDCFFQAPDTFERAFNILVNGVGGNINLRFRGTSAGAEQTWNAYDNSNFNDLWGGALALPAIEPGATYFLRVVGSNWDGGAATYDLHLSHPNSIAIAGSLTGQTRFQNATPTGPPNLVRFSAEFGASPGFIIDDVSFFNGIAPPIDIADPEITEIVFDPVAQTTTLKFPTLVGVNYSLQASADLENWLELDDPSGSGAIETFVESNVTATARYYRLLVLD